MTGIVVAVDEQSVKVRVQFPDRDDLVSDWLPVLQDFCVGNQHYRLPDVDNQVACLMDDNYEAGVVLGAIYSDADAPPVTSADIYYRRFKDGTVIQYDRAGHKLTADIKGAIDIKATGDCDAVIDGKTTLQSLQGVEIDGGTGNPSGAVQGQCICPLINKPHLMVSATVKESL